MYGGEFHLTVMAWTSSSRHASRVTIPEANGDYIAI